MNERKPSIDNQNSVLPENEIQALEARRKDLLKRKDQVKDSFVSKHLDFLLHEVEDLLAKYDQSISMRRSVKNEGEK